jgi:hypothetical protein
MNGEKESNLLGGNVTGVSLDKNIFKKLEKFIRVT